MISHRPRRCPLRQPRVWLWALVVALPAHIAAGYALSLQRPGNLVACPVSLPIQVALISNAEAEPNFTIPTQKTKAPTPSALKSQPIRQTKLKQHQSLKQKKQPSKFTDSVANTQISAAEVSPPIMPDVVPIHALGFTTPPPPPHYPAQSRALGEEGTAMLLAKLYGAGQPSELKLEHSSGYARLDAAAMAAAKNWHFNAPSQAIWVRLPVRFTLRN